MIEFIVEALTVAADFLLDLWVNKITRKHSKK